jgi:hypothetical protein
MKNNSDNDVTYAEISHTFPYIKNADCSVLLYQDNEE